MKKELAFKKNENYIIDIEDVTSTGSGVGKIDGYTVFVDGAVKLDKVEITLVKVKNSYGYGRIVRIIEPSIYRVEPKCENADKCGGCIYQRYEYKAQLDIKRKMVKDNLEHIGKITGVEILPTIGMENPWNYRNKAQFPVGQSHGHTAVGFFAPRTHKIIELEECYIQHKSNVDIVKTIKNFIDEYKIAPYDEETHKGLIRHVLTRVGFFTGEIMVCIVVNAKKLPYAHELIEKLKEIKGMSSINLNYNTNRNNVILGDKTECIWGNPIITDYIGDVKFEISPVSFYQVNPVQTKIMYEKAMEYAGLTGNEIVWDAYCGIGTISLFLAKKAKKVYGVEIVEQAIEDAKKNASINNISNVEFFAGKAEEVIPDMYKKQGIKADVIVVDPPRKGCDKELLDTILEMSPQRVVYVSCDSATLARDLEILCMDGKYKVEKVQPVDNFCMTGHVECVVLLSQ